VSDGGSAVSETTSAAAPTRSVTDGRPWAAPEPQLLGKAVSHGCVRMSDAAALVLKRLTPAGTPLTIVR